MSTVATPDTTAHDVTDLGLAPQGKERIEWAERSMPVLRSIRERFERETPLAGLRVAACLHVTTETANLMRTLAAGGAETVLCASNPLSTQDDVAAALVAEYGVRVYARRGENNDTYYDHINAAIDHKPHITMDDGADVIGVLHEERPDMIEGIIGGTEETTTGVIRLKALQREGKLKFPIVAVNDSNTKHLFDNRYGTGQSTWDGIIRATNTLIAGKNVVVAGYGWCGRGIADRARGLGARVTVTEVNALRALQAHMDGFTVARMEDALPTTDIVVTATGNRDVITADHTKLMKDGAIIANSGHFNVEIDVEGIQGLSTDTSTIRKHITEYVIGGNRIHLIAEGRLVNLGAAEGHPASVMDMSFANQALAAEWMADNADDLTPSVVDIPPSIDRQVSELKLATEGITIDTLTPEQVTYLDSWNVGT